MRDRIVQYQNQTNGSPEISIVRVDIGLAFREITMNDPLPKGKIQQAVMEFLQKRDDVAILRAPAVIAYFSARRMIE